MPAMATFIRLKKQAQRNAPSEHKGSRSSHSCSKEPGPERVKPRSSKEKNVAIRPDWVDEVIERQIESVSHLLQLEKQAKINKKLKSDSNTKECKFKRHQKQYELSQAEIHKIEEAMEASDEDEQLESLPEGKDLLIEFS